MKLIQGDCLEVMKGIEDGSVDMVLTDPPYGTTACKWDSIIPLEPMWKQLKRIIKPNGAIVLFGSEPFSSALRMSNIKNYRYDWVWKKTKPQRHLLAKKMPMSIYENISVFYDSLPLYSPQMRKGTPYTRKHGEGSTTGVGMGKDSRSGSVSRNKGERYPVDVIDFPNGNNKSVHPTQKPVALMEYLIKTYTNEKELVLDFTMGSGTAGVACVNLNRDFIGIELDSEYFEIAKKRIAEAEKQKKERLF